MALSRRFPRRKSTQFLKKIFAISVAFGCLPIVGYFMLLVPLKKPALPLANARDVVNMHGGSRDATNDNQVHLVSLETTRKPSTTERRQESNHGDATLPRRGILEVHTWLDLCGMNVKLLRSSPHFPFFPDIRSFVSTLHIPKSNKRNFGQRIFGFIHPHTTSKYKFAISSDDTSELWLSLNEDPNFSRLIAGVYSETESAWTDEGDYKKYSSQISQDVALEAGKKYYFEAILQQGNGLAHMSVYWACLSAANSSFEIVTSEYLSAFFDSKDSIQSIGNLRKIPGHAGKPTKIYSKEENNSFYRYYRLPLVGRGEYYSSVPSCPYNPSFLIKEKLRHFSGVWRVKVSRMFPRDNTDMYTGIRGWSGPNLAADEKLIHKVVSKLLSSFKSRKYVLQRIHKVIQKEDPKYGNRFSVDLEFGLQNTTQLYRLSEHVYLKNDNESLCFPEGINWNNSVTVYFILPVKDQGKWVYHFINQLSEASLLTGDTNFHVIVIDFESQDIDMRKAFNTSLLSSRHTVVNLQGKFYKTLALNKGVERVPSPHDIVFLFDLHIDVPADILESVRKNTIEGRIAYFPIVGRLDCGSTSSEHRGFWQMDGYGLAAVYKSDWIRFGGMNIKDFKYDWGGEDWDLVDRVLNAHLEIERVKQPGLYHHYHSKTRQWQTT